MRLRIISGELKGRFISAPTNGKTRPTTDRVRESIFNILNNRLYFEDIMVLDIFAGSGSLGIEAISRGAKHCYFIDKDAHVVKNLESNISDLGIKGKSTILRTDVLAFLNKTEIKFDLIFADPPFFEYLIWDCVKTIQSRNLLSEDGLLVVERSNITREKDEENFHKSHDRKMGDALIYFFEFSTENSG